MKKKNAIDFPGSIEKNWDITRLIIKSEYKRTYLLKRQIGGDTCILQVIPKHHFSRKKYYQIDHLSHDYFVLPTEFIFYKGNCFILYPMFLTLQKILADPGLSLEEIYQLGLDMTHAALELIQHQIYHADISPTNIYRGSNGHFCLGDLDILRQPTGTTPDYTAPEEKNHHKYPCQKKDKTASFDLSMQYAIGKLILTLLQLCKEFNTEEITHIPSKACSSLPEQRFSSLTDFQKEMKKFSHSPAIDIPSSTLRIIKKDHALFQKKTKKLPTRKEKYFFPILWSAMTFASCILLILLIFFKQPQEKTPPDTVFELQQKVEYDTTSTFQKQEENHSASLKELDIQGGAFSSLDEAMESLSSEGTIPDSEYGAIECLYAGENQLTDLSSVSRFPKIREIYLNQNNLREKDVLLPLLQSNSLEILVLSQNNLQELPDLTSLKNLIHLDISSNPDFHDYKSLSQLTQLRFLNLSNTKIQKKEIKILEKNLPDCEIISSVDPPHTQ